MGQHRKIPLEVTAVEWDGTSECFEYLKDWTDSGFVALMDGTYTAEVFDVLHDTWVKLRTGDYILKGLDGEFYPCEKSVFERTHEVV